MATPLFQKKFDNKKKTCFLSALKATYIDYKNIKMLSRFISVFDRILPARITGASVRHQRMIGEAIKRARFMALLPYHNGHRSPKGDRKF